MNRCVTCGGEVGEHYDQCPEGSEALPYGSWEATAVEASDMLKLVLQTVAPGRGRTYEALLFPAAEIA